MKKILIIRLGAIGDVVHSTVIQQSIKQKYPEYEISFLTSELISPLIEDDINLKKVYTFSMKQKNNLPYLLKLGFELRKEKFDIVINLTNSLRNNFISLIINPKKLLRRNKNRVHAVDAFFNSAKEFFNDIEKPENIKLYLDKNSLKKINEMVEKYPKPYFIISPGGEHDNYRQGRIWPDKYWIELSNKLISEFKGTIFIAGSKGEQKSHKKLSMQINNSVLMSGELTLEESACLFSMADIFISGDSGPLHIASALGIKTLGIMGSTAAVACGPYGKNGYSINSDIECIGCNLLKCPKLNKNEIYTPCMTSLYPKIVMSLVEHIYNLKKDIICNK